MAELYELVPANPHKRLKRQVELLKDQAKSNILAEELLRSNLESQEHLAELIADLKKSLASFNKVVEAEKELGVKQIKDKLIELIKQNAELIEHVTDMTEKFKKILEEKQPVFREVEPTSPPPVPSTKKEIHSIPFTYRRTKEVTNE